MKKQKPAAKHPHLKLVYVNPNPVRPEPALTPPEGLPTKLLYLLFTCIFLGILLTLPLQLLIVHWRERRQQQQDAKSAAQATNRIRLLP